MSTYEEVQAGYYAAEASFREAFDLMNYYTEETDRRNKAATEALKAMQAHGGHHNPHCVDCSYGRPHKKHYLPPGVDPCRYGHNTFLKCPPQTCRCAKEFALKKQRGE